MQAKQRQRDQLTHEGTGGIVDERAGSSGGGAEKETVADEPGGGAADVIGAAEMDKTLVRARKKFDRLDVNGNGVLDGDELVELSDWLWSSFHPGGRALTEEEKQAGVDKLLHRLDENGDGVMEFEEFREWFHATCESISLARKLYDVVYQC